MSRIAALEAEVRALKDEVASLKKEVAELKRQTTPHLAPLAAPMVIDSSGRVS